MKILPKLLLVVFVMITACSEDDDKKVKLSARELLIKYDWIVFTVQRESFPGSEPDIVYTVWSFSETNYSIADYTGTFYEKGDWSVEDDVMTLEDESVPILELTAKKFVYEAADGARITRLPVAKINE
jgi:hypothetical protein